MAIEFKLPALGENIASGDVVSVLVKEGDVVEPNQGVIEIETDKAVIEVPCAQGGRVSQIHVKAGDTVNVGATVLTLEAAEGAAAKSGGGKSGGAKPADAKAPAKAAPAKPAAKAEAKPAVNTAAKPAPEKPAAKSAPAAAKPAPAKQSPAKEPAVAKSEHGAGNGRSQPTPATSSAQVAVEPAADDEQDEQSSRGAHHADPAGPAVRRLARELGVDLAHVTGSGPGGRIVREDIVAAVRHANATLGSRGGVAEKPPTDSDAWGGIHREPLSKMRKTIAANMVRSATTIPHVTNFDDADITELERIRKGSAADYAGSSVKLTSLSFLMKAVALALKMHPTINASLDLENGQIIYKDYVNLGVAIDTERGLVVPVIRNADRLTIPHIAQSITTLVDKAKKTQFTIDDMRGGSFTLSNLGAIGGTYSTPIINYPEVAILLVGRARKLPVVIEDRIEPRLMMPLSLSYDHRLVDGATAARFLNDVIDYLETPGRLLLAP